MVITFSTRVERWYECGYVPDDVLTSSIREEIQNLKDRREELELSESQNDARAEEICCWFGGDEERKFFTDESKRDRRKIDSLNPVLTFLRRELASRRLKES